MSVSYTHLWADNKGTETRTVTLTKVTQDKTVTADNVQPVAATQATLTLNLDGAYLNINNKAYWDGDTISADFDSVLTATVVLSLIHIFQVGTLRQDTQGGPAGQGDQIDPPVPRVDADPLAACSGCLLYTSRCV